MSAGWFGVTRDFGKVNADQLEEVYQKGQQSLESIQSYLASVSQKRNEKMKSVSKPDFSCEFYFNDPIIDIQVETPIIAMFSFSYITAMSLLRLSNVMYILVTNLE